MAVRILTGDCRDVLATLPDESVHCVVTSPPYFGLRDYGTATWVGGDPSCSHVRLKRGASTIDGGGYQSREIYAATCRQCGAQRVDRQIGLEDTPTAFVAEMVAVFREVRRVLRKDGTLWLNLGDSYAGSWGAQGRQGASGQMANRAVAKVRERSRISAAQIEAHPRRQSQTGTIREPGLKPKDLIGIPWRVAFALQDDGWWLRQDIIWHKPNPMPESITDRCTKAHEYLFLLTKSERYHFDAEAIREATSHPRGPGNVRPVREVEGERTGGNANLRGSLHEIGPRDARNKRSVWTVATAPFSEAHFATFPPDLIDPCIKAGCPAGGTVLDPFGGAGTTGLVADRLGRDALLIELNPSYATMARDRLARDGGMFANLAAE